MSDPETMEQRFAKRFVVYENRNGKPEIDGALESALAFLRSEVASAVREERERIGKALRDPLYPKREVDLRAWLEAFSQELLTPTKEDEVCHLCKSGVDHPFHEFL